MSIDPLAFHRIHGTYVPSTARPANTSHVSSRHNGRSMESTPSLGKRALELLRSLCRRITGRPKLKMQLVTRPALPGTRPNPATATTNPTLLKTFKAARLTCVTSARRTHTAEHLSNPFLMTPSGRILHDYDTHWEKTFNDLCEGRSLNHAQVLNAAREADFLTCVIFYPKCVYNNGIGIEFFYDSWKLAYSLLAEMPSGQQPVSHYNVRSADPLRERTSAAGHQNR
jgi:hypothetical protein